MGAQTALRRVLDKTAVSQPVAGDAIYVRGARAMQVFTKMAGSVTPRLQCARSNGAWQPLDGAQLIGNYGHDDVWGYSYVLMNDNQPIPWDWFRFSVNGDTEQFDDVAVTAWTINAPKTIGHGIGITHAGTVTTATTELTLVAGVDYSINDAAGTITPIGGGQLTNFATDGALIIHEVGAPTVTSGQNLIDVALVYDVAGGPAGSVEAPSDVVAATGDPLPITPP